MTRPARLALTVGGALAVVGLVLGFFPLPDPAPVVIGATRYAVDCGSLFLHGGSGAAAFDPCGPARAAITGWAVAAFALAAASLAVGALICVRSKPADEPDRTLTTIR